MKVELLLDDLLVSDLVALIAMAVDTCDAIEGTNVPAYLHYEKFAFAVTSHLRDEWPDYWRELLRNRGLDGYLENYDERGGV